MSGLLDGLRWRLIGPFRGGRVVAVTGHPTERLTFYFGSTGGGVWKTIDAGRTWRNVSDGFFRRASVGAIALSEADPNVLYAGMGECCIRNTVSHGDGVYRSDDGGRTWVHRGLEATRHIGRVRIDPRDPDRVYVAALGHAHGPNPERGVYRSTDGGRSWDLVLHRGDNAGAVDLALDPHNRRCLYATTWEARRLPWRLDSGGDGSGLWRSDDAGDTWSELSRKPGLPTGVLGRIGVAPSPAQAGRVWAIVEAEDGAVFRSDDFGEHWVRLSEQWELRQRPFYYSHIHADPRDPETVWALNGACWRSIDGGRSFAEVAVQHGDCHDLWQDPADPDRLILGDDGGAAVSMDGARSWSSLLNQPTAELYHVTTDDRQPYRVYASQQDNSSLSLPSHSESGVITVREMYTVGGGECGHIAVQPDDPDVVFAADYNAELTRYDHRTRSAEHVWPWPDYLRGGGAEHERYRFNWTAPVLISPHDAGTLYVAGNVVFRSRDRGQSWETISPDLTRADPDKLRSSGGPITQENGGAEYWCTVFALAESPLQAGLLWAGSDDGRIHVSEDGGTAWREVTPTGLPEWATVSIIDPSPHDARTAYVAVERHRLDDFAPCLYRTRDLGASWERIDAGIPDGEFCRVVREDPGRRGLLFAGTEAGLYASFDDGGTWQSCRGNLPVCPVHDIVIKDSDLIAATHGRSIWILDDLPALRQHSGAIDEVRLYDPRPYVRWYARDALPARARAQGGSRSALHWTFGLTVETIDLQPLPDRDEAQPRYLDAGENSASGVTVLYELPEPADRTLSLSFHDESGEEVRRLVTRPEDDKPKPKEDKPATPEEPHPPRRAGLNRFVWDTTIAPIPKIDVDAAQGDLVGDFAPWVLPGRYEVRLTLGDVQRSAWFEIALDPRMRTDERSLRDRHALMLEVYARLGTLNRTVNLIRQLKRDLSRWVPEAKATQEQRTEGVDASVAAAPDGEVPAALRSAIVDIRDAATAIEEELTPADVKGWSLLRVITATRARLDIRLARIVHMLAGGVGPVPTSTAQVAGELITATDAAVRRYEELIAGPVDILQKQLTEAGIGPLAEPRRPTG